MRPRLKPALRRIHRDERTLQFGTHPHRAVVLTDLVPGVRRWIESLDGTRDLAGALTAAADAGIGERQGRLLIDMLVGQGVVDDAGVPPHPLRALTLAERDRLQPDLDALSLPAGVTDGGFAALERRRAAQVRVYGAGRVGAQLVALLAASGVGRICVIDPGTARPRDLAPGGLTPSELGMSRQDGAVAVARRLAPAITAWTGENAAHLADGSRRPDLVVLAPVEALDGLLVRELAAWEIPHLLVSAFEGSGSVGPLVLPGRSACLQCLDLARRDRDPGWPVVSARLGGFPAGEIACGAALSALVAAMATGHALALIDGHGATVTNGTIDILPDWRWKKTPWSVHPQCRCFRNEFGSLTMGASATCR
ncbi:ThiF family adenylyltransferase [Planobispora rosea]|nr:ThiF family adenylyltransferase [Planobispora rosea]